MGSIFPPRSLHIRIGKKQIGFSRLTLCVACVLSLLTGSASPHDASSYGGVFRSRDLGATWLNADVGLFLNAALIIAIDPRDSSHLLAGTDLGILSSHNAGAVGCRRRATSSSARYLRSPSRRTASWPCARQPAACFVATGTVGGASRLRSRHSRRTRWSPGRPTIVSICLDGAGCSRARTAAAALRPCRDCLTASDMTALVAIPGSSDILAAVIDGRAMISHDGGRILAQRRFRRHRHASRHGRDRCDAAATHLGGRGRPDRVQ